MFEPKVFVFAEKLFPKVVPPPDVEGLPKAVGLLPKVDVLVLLFPKVVPPPKPPVGAGVDPKALAPKVEAVEFPKPPNPPPVVEGDAVFPRPKEKEGAELLLVAPNVVAKKIRSDEKIVYHT